MKTDFEIKNDVINELTFEPSINAVSIGVAVKEGIVTLSGSVPSYHEKFAAEKAVKRVKGVKAVVEDIQVNLEKSSRRRDEEIAEAALRNLEWFTTIPEERIILKVQDGWISLEGTVDWNYQKEAAQAAVKDLIGIKGISNSIKVKAEQKKGNLKDKIKETFLRSTLLEPKIIDIRIVGQKVILSGNVYSWSEKELAEILTWNFSEVSEIENNIEVI